jgi:hypothetical protein
VFEFYDFITLDDGEAPIENLIAYITKNKTVDELKRTFLLQDEKVVYINNTAVKITNRVKWVHLITAI